MNVFYMILLLIPTLNVLWWWWAGRRLARAGAPRWTRAALAAFVLLHLAGYAWVILSRRGGVGVPPPMPVLATVYVWCMVVLPLTCVGTVAVMSGEGVLAAWRWLQRRWGVAVEPARVNQSRRRALASMALVGAPVAAHAGALAEGLASLGTVRTRAFEVPIRDLPRELEGFCIAHVSDTHVGRFTRGAALRGIADTVNAMSPDLVVLTGDLIDYTTADLPEAISFLRSLRSTRGLALCEGNHDLFEGVEVFRRGVRDAGLNLLTNESMIVPVGSAAVQVLGIAWGARRGAEAADHVARVARLREPGTVPILLAHHPHAFDAAAETAIPLTLAGHTHGGQLMLTDRLGAGPAIFKYWSGLYQRGASSLVVSNGAGNWFPLRVNAPAEVATVTLRRAEVG
ncbi:MAG: hypothetical protein HBSAPP03_12240 [Phycisphaerae bacterium]|nr:MAG: hypothetical protein HBSAPP03_12240 [Phycisphaerae bacterium]